MFIRAAVTLAFCLGASLAQAQTFTPEKADRAAAQKEGQLHWYSSTPFPLVQVLADRFEKQTGIRVTLLRSGGESVLRRFLQEYQAGAPGADVITMSDAGAASGLTKRGVFAPFRPEGFDKLVPEARDPQGHWIAQRVTLSGITVRTDKVAEADRPKTWADLADPKYKGMMVMADPSFTAIQLTVVGMLSRQFGWSYYEALRKNDTMIVQGHQQVFKTLAQGERIIGAEANDPRTYNAGEPLPNQTLVLPGEGAFIVVSPVAIVKNARHPNAAKLFAEFMLSPDVQRIIVETGIHSPRTDVAAPKGRPALSEVKFLPIDVEYIETQARQLKSRFTQIFN